jgi:hypothetical protein
MVLQNQGMLGIAFFEATAVIILLVLFLLFRRDQQASYFRFWLSGWCCLTFSSLCEVAVLIRKLPGLNLISVLAQAAALVLFLVAVNLVSAAVNRIDSGDHLLDRKGWNATGYFASLGNGRTRELDLPGGGLVDVEVRDGAPQSWSATACRDFPAKGIARDGLSAVAG